jgi:hypothetical protein
MRSTDHPFKIHAWSSDGNRIEEELAAFGNQIVAARCFDVCVRYYAKRRLTLRHGARVLREHVPPDAPTAPAAS